MGDRTCSVEGCEQTGRIKVGMCGKHYQRLKKHGSPDLPAKVWRMCDGPECFRRAGNSGLCPSHYKQRHLGKELAPLLVATKNLGRPATCQFEGCDRPHKARGLCKAHNDQIKNAQTLRPIRPRHPGRSCSENDCHTEAVARGVCARHWQTFYGALQRFGLSIEQYEAMRRAQGDRCAICRGVNRNGQRLSIDHDHACCPRNGSCGRCVRGLLCAKCNFILGNADDDAARLREAAEYLDRRANSRRSA